MLRERVKVLMAKPGLDGHDRGALVVAAALRDAGIEVVYTGLHQTAEAIVAAAVQEDVDVIGLSCHSDNHKETCAEVFRLLREQDAVIPVVLGGLIPEEDVPFLKELGVAGVFPMGSRLGDIVALIRALAGGSGS